MAAILKSEWQPGKSIGFKKLDDAVLEGEVPREVVACAALVDDAAMLRSLAEVHEVSNKVAIYLCDGDKDAAKRFPEHVLRCTTWNARD